MHSFEETEQRKAELSFCFVRLCRMESIADETNTYFLNDKDLEILVVASIQTLKRGNKKCRNEQFYRLVKDLFNKQSLTELQY